MAARRSIPALVLGVILVAWVWVMRRRMRGWNNLYILMVLVCVVGWMLDVVVVVWLLVVVVVCVRDDSLVVGWLCSRHPVPGGLRFRAISCWVYAILVMKQALNLRGCCVRPRPRPLVPLPRPWGIFLTASGLAGGVLAGYVVHLLLIEVVPSGVWLRRPGPGSAGLRRVLRLSLRFDLSLM
jgi:hypothetical protein